MPVSAKHALDFLSSAASKVVLVPMSQIIFRQGSAADSVFYIEEGKVRLTVVSKAGKEAIVALLGAGDFFGEASLTAQGLRVESATAMTYCQLLQIKKEAMMLALHQEHKLSDLFITSLLARNSRYEQDLVDQLFNSSEKRLARILLLLAQFGTDEAPETIIRKISQGTLAEMVGTTRSRVNFFMNRFRTSGFINYGTDGIQVNSSLLNVLLKD
jgi:CRP/FNR family transcriptional regulator, cyclic AMP receptor protein